MTLMIFSLKTKNGRSYSSYQTSQLNQFLTKPSLTMNFFQIIRKGTSKTVSKIRNTAIYDFAAEKLEPKPYAQQAKPLFLASKWFSNLYHFLSYIIAFFGLMLFAYPIESWFQRVAIGIIGTVLLFLIELAKSNTSHSVFSSIARKETVNKLFLSIFIVSTLFSFFVSVYSAKQAVFYAATTDKITQNNDALQNETDSIKSVFDKRISIIQNSLESSSATLKKYPTGWKANTARQDLEKANESLEKVIFEKEKSLSNLSERYGGTDQKTTDAGTETAIIAAVLFALFEMLNVLGYWFYYYYLSNCLLEKDLVLTNTDNAISRVIDNLGTFSVNTQSVPTNLQPTSRHHNPIGFQTNYQKNDPPKTIATQTVGNGTNGTKKCNHCRNEYIYKVSRQKFCSDKCRIENWKQVKGKTFKKGKK